MQLPAQHSTAQRATAHSTQHSSTAASTPLVASPHVAHSHNPHSVLSFPTGGAAHKHCCQHSQVPFSLIHAPYAGGCCRSVPAVTSGCGAWIEGQIPRIPVDCKQESHCVLCH
jgi:hypothetical protein